MTKQCLKARQQEMRERIERRHALEFGKIFAQLWQLRTRPGAFVMLRQVRDRLRLAH